MKEHPYPRGHNLRDGGAPSERQFLKWCMQEQSRNHRLTLKYDLAKASLPYIPYIVVLLAILIVIVFGQDLLVVPLVWMIHSLWKRSESRSDR